MKIPIDARVNECTIAYIWKGEDGYIYVKHKENVHIRFELQMEAFAITKSLITNKPSGVIIDLKGIHSIDKKSRDYPGLESHEEYTFGVALLISSRLSKLFGNFFMGFNKAKFPTKLFTDIDEGRKWLKTLQSKDSRFE
ncbi:MAG: hypothetical protein JKY09_05395 [Crocinitomicaceae bacterium]|nr:hypothetical protein [Crocinitomicaceae bacterium]